MVIETEYGISDIVYLKTDSEQKPRIVFAIKVYKTDVLYELACGTTTSMHYDFEISTEINVLLTTTN